MLSRTDLHPYQEHAINFIMEEERCGLFLGLGLGKTTSTLTALQDLSDSMAISKALVIAPLRVANTVWKQETAKWRHLKDLKVSICTGNETQRLAGLNVTADVYVINRENIPWLVALYKKRWPFDAVVIDESSSFKNSRSKRFRALKSILHLTQYLVLLTGTPAPNGLMDLWAQMYLIDFGERLGRTVTNYRRRFFTQEGFGGFVYKPKPDSSAIIHNLIKDKALSMTADDYLDLPECVYLTEFVELPPAAKKKYEEFEKELLLPLADGEYLEASTAAVLANKLSQMCNGAAYIDEAKNWHEFHTVKLDRLAEIIEDNSGENMLVAYNFKSDLERLKAKFPSAKVLSKSGDEVKEWNRGEIPLLLAQPQSAGHGLNLQEGGSLIVWFGLNWSLELYQQFNGRLHRQGQGRPVRIMHIIAKDCLDERIMRVLSSKCATQGELITALKVQSCD